MGSGEITMNGVWRNNSIMSSRTHVRDPNEILHFVQDDMLLIISIQLCHFQRTREISYLIQNIPYHQHLRQRQREEASRVG